MSELYIGVMSGTSLDGIDIALTEITSINDLSTQVRLLEAKTYPIPKDLKQAILAICHDEVSSVAVIGKIDHQIGQLIADAVLEFLGETKQNPKDIVAIGSHGQTVFHSPQTSPAFTMQLGDPNLIACLTQIDTVADFRRKDMALGGQGAPLIPAFHQAICPASNSNVIMLNIGGMANITVLEPEQGTLGFDTGPGNVLMDIWAMRHLNHPYDPEATLAIQGKVNEKLLKRLLAEPYFQQAPPKSTGRELFNANWLDEQLRGFTLSIEDVQRTLCELSAQSIAKEIKPFTQNKTQLYLFGGGVNNPLLFARLCELLPQAKLQSTSVLNIDPNFMEAVAFAWFAHQRVHGLPSNLPQVTGAKKLTSLGGLYLAG